MRTALFLLLPALSMMIASALEIRSAKFGVGDKWADVTEPFKQLKANDDLYIGWIDGNRMAGRDPAPRIAKKLVVVYVDNDGTEKTAMLDERTINGVAANTPVSQEFQLGSAWFGDHGKYLNITEKMREIIASNREVTLDFPTLGIDVRDDPVPGKKKLVVLFYSIDGRQYCKQLWEKDKFKGSSISGAFDPIPEAKNARTPFRGMELDTAVWQWAMPVDGVISGENGLPPVAYLYIPPKTANVRGIVVGQFNMLELPILEHPKFRETLQKLDFAAVWIAPSLFGADFNFKDAGKAAAVGKMFEDLAELSGCRELATAPLVGIGHSAMANFPWELAARKPERALAGISYDGTFASQAGTLNENDLKRLDGVFLDRVPQGRAERWSGKKAGEAIAHGSDAERIQIFPICGPVVRIDNETMAVRFNRFGFTSSRRTGEIYMIAVYPGDDTYRRIVQQSVMMIPHRNTKGVAQRIEFPEIPDQRVGTNSVTLQARANTGMPVAYYVEYGPAYLKDNELIFTEIPAGAKFPVEVSVVAYQYGNAGKPQLQSANPVTRRFRIVK